MGFIRRYMSIYKTKNGREKSLELYDRQLLKLGKSFSDIYVQTSFGKTHIVKIGNSNETPLLVFHGGNSTSAYNLLMCRFLLEDFHVYAVDIIGHPEIPHRSINKKGEEGWNILMQEIYCQQNY